MKQGRDPVLSISSLVSGAFPSTADLICTAAHQRGIMSSIIGEKPEPSPGEVIKLRTRKQQIFSLKPSNFPRYFPLLDCDAQGRWLCQPEQRRCPCQGVKGRGSGDSCTSLFDTREKERTVRRGAL